MPVNILYCEGVAKSPDVRVLSVIIPPGCVVRPVGSKQGLAQRILGAKDVRTGSTIAGLRDRDFDDDQSPPQAAPRNWHITEGGKQVPLGWYWERKEIENYLIDSKVVGRALGEEAPPLEEYRQALKASAQKIAVYTAARITLSLYLQNRPSPPNNFWGEERDKKQGYRFPKDRGLTEANCKSELNNIIKQYEQRLALPKRNPLDEFERLLPTCCPGGSRFQNQNYITFFAGKDLLYGMREQLCGFGFESPVVFRERILKGIEESAEDVWTWLPEWQRLRELIAQ
ncbi:hypothetical protein [Fischerella sp. PCC 9605]|uniref:hypothetical protein n=1 Tax=Fischerella sp. PCC 9605 TaxID=1173024 RepID=UPI00047ABF76|nr:hypothetical protein [Fischerella sp. PCC 9605]